MGANPLGAMGNSQAGAELGYSSILIAALLPLLPLPPVNYCLYRVILIRSLRALLARASVAPGRWIIS